MRAKNNISSKGKNAVSIIADGETEKWYFQLLNQEEDLRLLWNVLPDVLTDAQKQNKINNLLSKLRMKGKIYCYASGRTSTWYVK